MFAGYEAVREIVERTRSECLRLTGELDETDEYEGVLILLLRKQAGDDLVNRCAMLVLDGAGKEDLRRVFGDEVYDEGVRVYEEMHRRWSEKYRKLC